MKALRIAATMAALSVLLATTSLALSHEVAASSIQQASFTTFWHDPPGAVVNQVRSAVATSFDDNGNVTAVNCLKSLWWLSETGWEDQADNIDCVNRGTTGDSSVYARYYNAPFCGDTWTYYSRNHATADVNGTHGFTDNTYATGKCSTWLWTDYLFEPGLYH